MAKKSWRELRKRSQMTVSASQFETARLCLRKWWLSKVRRLPETQSTALVFGDVLHAVVERYLRADNRGRDKDTLKPVELFPEGWENAVDRFKGKVTGQVTPAEQALIKKLVTKGIENGTIHREPGGEVERSFKRRMLEYRGVSVDLVGFIDYELPGEIQDHKTSKNTRWLKSPKKLVDNIQMNLYGKEHLLTMAERGIELNEVRFRHNQFVKTPNNKGELIVKKTSVPVDPDNMESHWESCVDLGKKMVRLRENAEKWSDCPDPDDFNKACNAYGGCPMRDICVGRLDENQYEKRFEIAKRKDYTPTVTCKTTERTSAMSLKDRLAKKSGGGSKPKESAEEAPVNPPQEEAPETNPSAGYVHEGDTPPWADRECKACEGSGLNTKGNVCAICRNSAKKRGVPDPAEYEKGTDEDGNIVWTLKGEGGSTGKQPAKGAEAPVVSKQQESNKKAGPLDKLKKGGGKVKEEPPAEESPQEAPEEESDDQQEETVAKPEKPASRGAGRPKKGFVLMIGAAPVKGIEKKGSGRAVYYLDDVIHAYGQQMAKDNDSDSFYDIDGFARRDALCAVAEKMAEDFGADIVVAKPHTAESRSLIEALRPLAGMIVEATVCQ